MGLLLGLFRKHLLFGITALVLSRCAACLVMGDSGRERREVGPSSWSLCSFHCPSSFDALFFSLLSNSSSGFGNLVPIWVSFLVCSGSDPHFNPYLAVTELNWRGSLSKRRICTHFASSLKFPSLSTFSPHSSSSAYQGLLLKPEGELFFPVLSQRMLELWIFVCWTWWMDVHS